MKARVLAMLMALVLTGMLAAAGGSQGSTQTQSGNAQLRAGSAVDTSQTVTVKVTRRGSVRNVTQENLFARFIRDRFNIVLNVTDIAANDYITRMNLMFAAGEADDLSLAHRPDFMLRDWIEAGHLRGFTQDDVQRLIPNYVAHYTREAWPVVWQNIRYSDNKTYYLPGRRDASMNMAWLYRGDVFDQYNLKVPNTTEDLFTVLMRLRQETGMFPIVEADLGSGIWAFTGFLQAFGLPELAFRDISMVNPRTNEFVPYVFTTDNYRRYLSYLNRLYANNLIWPEFATGTTEQRNSLQSRGNRFFMWGYPEQIPNQQNEISRTSNPNARWEWSKEMITENPSNGFYFKKDPYFAADGIGFSADASNAVVERFLHMLNWFYSDEGLVFRTYGIQGTHHQKQGNNYIFMPNMVNPNTPQGQTLDNFGWINFVPNHKNLNEYYRPYIVELENTFMNRQNYYFHTSPILIFTPQESTELADIQTVVNQTRDEFYARFVMGHLNVNDNSVWQNYINTMNQLGLQRVINIRNTAHNRN